MIKKYLGKIIGRIKKPFNLFIENLDGEILIYLKDVLFILKQSPSIEILKALSLIIQIMMKF